MATSKYGYVYIQSNDKIVGLIKIGITFKNPLERVASLSRATAAPGKFDLDWYMVVPDAFLAENMIKYKLQAFHSSKEFYQISSDKALKIIQPALIQLFKPSTKEERFLSLQESKKFPGHIDKKGMPWELLIPKFQNPICKEGVRLCLSEGKKGDPTRSRFISYRTNFKKMKVVHLFFTAKHISVVIEGKREILLFHILSKFDPVKTPVDLTKTASGYNLKIVTARQFAILCSWLSMGKKIKKPSY